LNLNHSKAQGIHDLLNTLVVVLHKLFVHVIHNLLTRHQILCKKNFQTAISCFELRLEVENSRTWQYANNGTRG